MNSNTIMKKINSIWAILLFAIVPMLFTSCEQQQDASNAILGTWKLNTVAYKYYEDGECDSGKDSAGNREWTFTSDNQILVETGNSEEMGPAQYTYYYEIDGNRIYTNYIEEEFGAPLEYFRIKRLTSTEMILLFEFSESYGYDGYMQEYKVQYLCTFTR